MSFKSWSLANPEKTRGYLLLQNELEGIEQSIKEYETRLENAKAGIVPKPDMFGILHKAFPIEEILLSSFGAAQSPDEIARRKKERQRKQDKEAIEKEIRDCEQRLNGFDLTFTKEPERQKGLYEERDELKSQLATYKPDPVHWNWRKGVLDADISRLSDALLARLTGLGWGTGGKYASFDNNFDELIDQLEDFFLDEIDSGANPYVQIRLFGGGWLVTVSDGQVAFTRYKYRLPEALMYTWLTYLDHTWDELVAEKHAN